MQIQSAHEVGSVFNSDLSDSSNTSFIFELPYRIHIAMFT